MLITAPRRFGKSTNLDMIKQFVEFVEVQKLQSRANVTTEDYSNLKNKSNEQNTENLDLFKKHKLNITLSKTFCDTHQQKYPVIYIDFKSMVFPYFNDVFESFKMIVFKIFTKHNYLLKSNKLDKVKKDIFWKYCDPKYNKSLSESELERGLLFLTKYLHLHFNKKVIVLIDEFDAPLFEAMCFNSSTTDKIAVFIKQLTSNLLKNDQFIERVLINACSITLARTLTTDIDSIEYFPFLFNHKFVQFYGFTEIEVRNLFNKFNVTERLNDMRKWYEGYKVQGKTMKMFSVWSVIRCLKSDRIKSYWVGTGGMPRLQDVFSVPEIRNKMISLVRNKVISVEKMDRLNIDQLIYFQNFLYSPLNYIEHGINYTDLFFHLLTDNGYLHVIRKDGDTVILSIPNAEVAHELLQNLYSSMLNDEQFQFNPVESRPLVNALNSLRMRYSNITY